MAFGGKAALPLARSAATDTSGLGSRDQTQRSNPRDQMDSPFGRQCGILMGVFIRGLLKQMVGLENLHLAPPRVNNPLGNDS